MSGVRVWLRRSAIRGLFGLILAIATGACESGDDGAGGGGGGGDADWATASCTELGVAMAPSGACLATDCAACPENTACGNQAHQYCRVDFCSSAADCGRTGWVCDYGQCFFPCSQDADCPGGMSCNANPISGHPDFCIMTGAFGGGGCGSCRTCYSNCSSDCSGMYVPASCSTTCMANCDRCCSI